MQMKRISIGAIALGVCLAVAFVPAATAKKKKPTVKTFTPAVTLEVSFETPTADPYTQYSQGAGHFSGQVSSGGPSACTFPRTVTISRDGAAFTQAGTNASGDYRVDLPGVPPPGSYTASVAQVVVKKKNKKTGKRIKKKCLPGTSAAVALP
jgi:hypothetical protein